MLRLISVILLTAASTTIAADKVTVYTTFYPTTWLTERIGGDLVEVTCPVPEEADPIFWRPSREAMGGYLQADLIIVNGAEFEKWVATADLPRRALVDTARSFRDDWIEFEAAVTHSHGAEGEHSHTGTDGHTWLDPHLAGKQARAIYDALCRRLPDHEAELSARLKDLEEDLGGLDRDLRDLGPLADGETLVASHPAYNYLARRYGWPIVNLDLDPSEVPDAETIAAAKEKIAHDGRTARFLIWESTPVDEAVALVSEELGLQSIVVSPCESLSPEARRGGLDYLGVMRENVKRLRAAFPAKSDV